MLNGLAPAGRERLHGCIDDLEDPQTDFSFGAGRSSCADAVDEMAEHGEVPVRDRTRELWRRDPVHQAIQSGWVDDGGLQLQSQGSESRAAWDAYTGYAQEGDLLVLFQGPLRFLPFPRNLFAEGTDWNDFLALVDSRLHRMSGPAKEKSLFGYKAFWITVLAAFLLAVAFAVWNASWNR